MSYVRKLPEEEAIESNCERQYRLLYISRTIEKGRHGAPFFARNKVPICYRVARRRELRIQKLKASAMTARELFASDEPSAERRELGALK